MDTRRRAAQVPATARRFLPAMAFVALAVGLIGAPPALAGAVPETFTFSARSTASDTVAVSGSVNAHGQETTLRIRFDAQGSEFCQSGGQSGSPSTGAATTAGGSAEGEVEITAMQGGLTPGAALCVQLTGSNGSGQAQPSGLTEVVVGAPEVAVQYHQGAGPTTVRALGEIWTAGQATAVHVEYAENDPVVSAFCASAGASGTHSATADQVVAAAASERPVAATLSGLDAAKGYCFRFVADTSSGDPVAAFPSSFLAGGPGVTTLAPASIGPFGVTLKGTVEPAGSATVARFDVAPSSSAFCLTGGTGAPAITTGDIAVAGTGQGVPVEAAIGSLLPLTGYCVRVAASNSRAETTADPVAFTTTTSAPTTPPQDGGAAPAGGAAAPEARPAPPAPPFGALSVPRVQSAKTFRNVTFAVSVGRSASVVVARLRLRGTLIGQLRTTGGPGKVTGRVPISARGRKLLGGARRAALQLTVTVTPPGGTPSSKRATLSLVRSRNS